MKTPYALGLIILFFLAIFLWVYPFPKQIDKEIPAIVSIADTPYPYETSDSEELAITHTNKPTVIHVKGTVYRKLFRQPELKTQITVDGFNWMTDGRHSMTGPLVGERKDGINMGSIFYNHEQQYSSSPSFGHAKFATVFFDNDFEQFHLWTTTEEWMGEEEPRLLKITGAAQNKEEAEQVLREIHAVYGDWIDSTGL
ncbi:hypothetical protein [Saccharibacillus sacchari]|uniref:hypothetical protein n=1 Tax=Saccharibacillus sacchari TaxID=456493 RepID=UPI0004BCA6E5|nr:hypothetical protein [Saccharibacillus sacchari]